MEKEELLKTVNGKNVTCAVVMIDKEGSILGCHPTSRSEVYDFPKGCAGFAEKDEDAAVRELQEETSILLTPNELARLVDGGIHPHTKEKLIHIFILRVDELPDPESLVCESFYEYKGKTYPEVDRYAIITRDKRNLFFGCLQDKFEIIDSIASLM